MLAISQETATGVLAAGVIVAGFVALAIVGWIFWRAAKHDRQAERDREAGR
jgi:cbb3-type cytochrome oxidase subunit 3